MHADDVGARGVNRSLAAHHNMHVSHALMHACVKLLRSILGFLCIAITVLFLASRIGQASCVNRKINILSKVVLNLLAIS